MGIAIMTNKLIRHLFRMATGALLGYLWGWIWGWSLADPNSDIYALAAGVGTIAGLILGALSSTRRFDILVLTATFGLYLSWFARTLFFGDIPGGWGIILMAGGVILSGAIGLNLSRQVHPALLPGLLGALYIGFFGGFVIDAIIMDSLLGWVHTHTILSQGPVVIVCGIIGGIGVAIRAARKGQRIKE
jgi:hypothetical protein